MAFLKIFSLVSLLAAIVIGAYLYVSHIDSTANPATKNPASSVESSAGNSVDNFNDQSQKNLQKAQDLNQ
jgi:uncharacterized protein (UPF0333 family)